MSVEPDHVYVIRPGYTVTLEEGRLHLGEPVEKRGHRRPVDDFFHSLAQEQHENALVVVLSGTGAAGFDDHLPKPLDPDKLIAMLGQLIR